jgi:hypothetical protein
MVYDTVQVIKQPFESHDSHDCGDQVWENYHTPANAIPFERSKQQQCNSQPQCDLEESTEKTVENIVFEGQPENGIFESVYEIGQADEMPLFAEKGFISERGINGVK